MELEYLPGILARDDADPFGGQLLRWDATLVGDLDGVPVKLTVYGERRHAVFLYGVSFASLGLDLKISRRSFFGSLGWPWRRPRVPVGSPLKEVVVIRSSNVDEATLVLNRETQAEILALFPRLPNLMVTDTTADAIDRRPRQQIPSSEEIVSLIWSFVRLANALTAG